MVYRGQGERERRRRRRSRLASAATWIAALALGTAYGSGRLEQWLPSSDGLPRVVRPVDDGPSHDGRGPADAAARAEQGGVQMSFGTCKWGGGRNCVVDGDTLFVGGAKVRIANIDAPETHEYGCPAELALGERSANRLRALVNSGTVRLRAADRDVDVYGRRLRTVEVDGVDVGEVLVSEGLARPYHGGRKPWC